MAKLKKKKKIGKLGRNEIIVQENEIKPKAEKTRRNLNFCFLNSLNLTFLPDYY